MSKSKNQIYILQPRDVCIVLAAKELLWKITRSTLVSAAQVEQVTRTLRVLDCMPDVSEELFVTVQLSRQSKWFGENKISHWWEVRVEGQLIEVDSGGTFDSKSTGHDSFTCMQWSVTPGIAAEFKDYLDRLSIVDDAMPFESEVSQMDFNEAGYSLTVSVEDEEIRGIKEDDLNQGQNVDQNFEHTFDIYEQLLMQQADFKAGLKRKETCVSPPDTCNLCNRGFSERTLFVDGRMRGNTTWAYMCSGCFFQCGEGIGKGDGQIFAKHANGKWLLVGGFSPVNRKNEEF